MQLIRFISDGKVYFGSRIDDRTAQGMAGNALEPGAALGQLRIDRLLAPIIPANLLCIGLNYRAHAAESGAPIPAHPVLFIKNSAALNDPGAPIELPENSSQVDYEAELAIVIGKTARRVSRANALEHVLGYTCANDVSARDWQRELPRSGGQWCRAKSFDGFCPLGPWIVTRDQIANPNALRIRMLLNGQAMQDSSTADMIFDIPTLIESLSSTMTLVAGTVILTGTPPGVGFARKPPVFLKDGDRLQVEIEGVGTLENPVVNGSLAR